MRIGILSRWNATCGVSLHAEALGREWVGKGHEILVLAPLESTADADWHHRHLDVADEPWVRRVYAEVNNPFDEGWVNVEEFLMHRFDVFLIEGYFRLPVRALKNIVEKIKRSGTPVVLVLHEYNVERSKPLMELPSDAIVVFDERFIREILQPLKIDLGKVRVISYPVLRPNTRDVVRPHFAEGKTLFFSFGRQPPEEYVDFYEALRTIRRSDGDVLYWIIRSDGELPFNEGWIYQWRERPSLEKLYSYLRGSDFHLLPKARGEGKVVVSSTIYQTIASGTPIITRDGRYVETIPTDEEGFGAIVKYRDVSDLVHKIELLMKDEGLRRRVIDEALKFTEEFSVEKVAEEYLNLFTEILLSSH